MKPEVRKLEIENDGKQMLRLRFVCGRLLSDPVSVLFYDLKFQIVKMDSLNEIVLCKACLAVSFEIGNIFVQTDGIAQIKLASDLI